MAFEALFKAIADFSSVKSEAKAAGDALGGMGDKAKKGGDDTVVGTDKVKGGVRGVGTSVAKLGAVMGGLAAISGISTFATNSVESFSKLEDATAAASVIFGDSMGDIQAQANTAATTLGMSQAQVIEAANTFGTYGKAAGLAGKDLSGFSTQMTALAGDMASFRGTSPEEAINAIGSALRGDTEPIRKYGVLLDQASIANEAMKMGLIKTTKDALTPQQKTLAVQSLILKSTTDAQGDYLRTSDSTANVAKTMDSTLENLTATIGGKLAPAFTAVRGAMIPVLTAIANGLGWLSENGQVAIPIVAGLGAILLAALAPALWAAVVATWAWTVAMLANPITWIVLGIGLLVAALVALAMNWDSVVAWVTGVWGGFVAWLGGIWDSIVAGVTGFGATLSAFFAGLWNGIVATAQAIWNGIVAFFTNMIYALVATIIGPIGMLVLFLAANWDRVASMASSIWNGIVAFFKSVPARIMAGLQALAKLPSLLSAWFAGVVTAARDKFNQAVAFVKSVPGKITAGLQLLASLGSKAAVWFAGVLTSARTKFGEVVSFVKGIPGKIVSALGNVGSKLTSAGRSLVNGFLNGIKAAWDGLVGWVKGGMDRLRGLWPFSPAKWGPFSGRGYVTYSGEAMGTDYAESLRDQGPKIGAGAMDMLRSAADAITGLGGIDLGAVVALDRASVDVVSGRAADVVFAGDVATSVSSTTRGGDTVYQLFLNDWRVGMDSKLEGAVRELVDAVGDRRRLDRTIGGQ